jgi:parallel beta-helix repeat protein
VGDLPLRKNEERTMSEISGIFGKGWRVFGLGSLAILALAFAGPSLGAADGAIPIYQAGTISSPGVYYLTQDISTGTGIIIASSNVTLDLNGHTLVSTGYGISTSAAGFTELRITNGRVSTPSGYYCINLVVSSGGFAQVDHLTVTTGIAVGCSSGYARAVIEYNTIKTPGVHGIVVSQVSQGRICGNSVTAPSPNLNEGISLEDSRRNIVSENVVDSFVEGIALGNSNENLITRNISSSNSQMGIRLGGSSSNNSLTMNAAASNGNSGIYIDTSCSGNVYAYNHTPGNGVFGIREAAGNTNGGGNYP